MAIDLILSASINLSSGRRLIKSEDGEFFAAVDLLRFAEAAVAVVVVVVAQVFVFFGLAMGCMMDSTEDDEGDEYSLVDVVGLLLLLWLLLLVVVVMPPLLLAVLSALLVLSSFDDDDEDDVVDSSFVLLELVLLFESIESPLNRFF